MYYKDVYKELRCIQLSPIVRKRLSLLINVAYFVLILAVFYLVFKTFSGILMPFLFAFVIAAILQKPVGFISRKTSVKRSVVSTVCVLFAVVIFIGLVVLLGFGAFGKIKEFADYLTSRIQNISELGAELKMRLLSAISVLPEGLRTRWGESISIFFDDLIENGFENFSFNSFSINWSEILSKGGGMLKDTVVQIPSFAISCIVAVVACVFMTADYRTVMDFIKRQLSPENSARITNAAAITSATMKKMLKAYGKIILITASELFIGLCILKLIGALDIEMSFVALIAILIAIIDIIPVLGTGTVLIPWALISFFSSNIKLGIGLIAMYVVILVIRQILEPKLVAGQVGIPAIVTITAMYIGTKTLGVLGFFILPFAVILVKELNDKKVIHLFKTKEDIAAAQEQNDTETSGSSGMPEQEVNENA